MTAPAPFLIDAVVSDSERPALLAVAEQLRDCLLAASGNPWQVVVRFRESLAAIDAQDRPAVVVASLLPELDRDDETIAATQARWHAQLSSLAGEPRSAILICTIFRHVAAPTADAPDARVATRERIRRLNLLAIDLSHDTGAGVVDIDRVFSRLGARPLGTDHRLTGPVAAEVAAHAIVASILGAGLDRVMSPEIQERAAQFQGPLRDVEQYVAQRLAR